MSRGFDANYFCCDTPTSLPVIVSDGRNFNHSSITFDYFSLSVRKSRRRVEFYDRWSGGDSREDPIMFQL